MPELPAHKRSRFENELGLTGYDAAQLTMDRAVSSYFEELAAQLPKNQAKLAANWVLGELSAALNQNELEIGKSPVGSRQLAALISRIIDGTVSNKMARDVFAAMWSGDGDPDAIITARGLKQISDSDSINAMIDDVLAAQPAIVQDYHAGKQKAFNSLVGQVMKAAKGKANPQQVNELLKQKLG
jgi:aspartyl-tRNA(Asn)/glutamyl-tRNA(Gln) amidotransferase subunit B